MKTMNYVVVFEKAPNNWGAFVPDLPGCVAVADTFEETKQLITEAIEFHIEAHVVDDEALPEPTCVDAAVVEVTIPEATRFYEEKYPLWEPEEHTDAAEVAD